MSFSRQLARLRLDGRDADGIGPLFNAQSCSVVHSATDGASLRRSVDDPVRGLINQAQRPGDKSPEGIAFPTELGDQIQDRSILGVELRERSKSKYHDFEVITSGDR